MRYFYLCWVCLAIPVSARADVLKGDGFTIQAPSGWIAQQNIMGIPLMARPDRDLDAEGWGQDLLTVVTEPHDARRTCLEGYTLRKLGEFAYHAAAFKKLEEVPLELPEKGGRAATRLTLRYTEGPRQLMAYVMIMDAGPYFVTATLTSSPARFEFQRAPFRAVVDSLRAASTHSTSQ